MTNQINYQSKEWAEDVASRLDDALDNVREAACVLRWLVEDMDADGNDYTRGPHTPPIEDVRALLRIASSLLAQQSSSWMGYALPLAHDAHPLRR